MPKKGKPGSNEFLAGSIDLPQLVKNLAGRVGEFGTDSRRDLTHGFERILVSADLGQSVEIRHIRSPSIVRA